MMKDVRTDEVLGPALDYTYWEEKSENSFIVFVDVLINICSIYGGAS